MPGDENGVPPHPRPSGSSARELKKKLKKKNAEEKRRRKEGRRKLKKMAASTGVTNGSGGNCPARAKASGGSRSNNKSNGNGDGNDKNDSEHRASKRRLEPSPATTSSFRGGKRRQKNGPPSSSSEANGRGLPSSSRGVECIPPYKYLTPSHPEFPKVCRRSYPGFAHDPASNINFHQEAKRCLEGLEAGGYYQYDIVQAGAKGLSRTFVRRTLVGIPGITYKYLRLRLFAHSWDDDNEYLAGIKKLNDSMMARTSEKQRALGIKGSFNYNLTLINYMEPDNPKLGLKQDSTYGMGTVSVSWHCDSSLEDFSSIGVYHLIDDRYCGGSGSENSNSAKCDWRIALRITPEAEARGSLAPPLVIPTENGDAYYLMGNFNLHHQHAVLSGSLPRYSSTHRVAVVERDTLKYIQGRVGALPLPPIREASPEEVQEEQKVLDELEFEWLRQYWIQGEAHDRMRKFWQKPMRELESLWAKLELRTKEFLSCDRDSLSRAVRSILLEALRKRQKDREKWKEREDDKIYRRRIQPEYRPVIGRPKFLPGSLPRDLTQVIEELAKVVASQPKSKRSNKRRRIKIEAARTNSNVAKSLK